ncbi:MAG: hypothetical protein OER04_13460 [Cyclobacteriaceae bacterium]|nr:hypothetical protein [Cyclobacteriaceae bacterium]
MRQPKEIVERLNILFYAMVGLPMLLFAWIYLPIKDMLSWQESQAILPLGYGSYVMAMILAAAAIWALRIPKNKFKQVQQTWSLNHKLQFYTKAYSKPFLSVMLLSLWSVVLLYLTRSQLFVVVYALLLFLVSLYRPSFQRICGHLHLSKEEQSVIKG